MPPSSARIEGCQFESVPVGWDLPVLYALRGEALRTTRARVKNLSTMPHRKPKVRMQTQMFRITGFSKMEHHVHGPSSSSVR